MPPRPTTVNEPQAPQPPSTAQPSTSQHGGHREGSGRDPAPYKRKNVTIELPEPLIDNWDAHCTKHDQSRAESLAKWLKWKKPGKKK